ncbi:MAG: tyrosine-type recombinase/integrase [Streptococcus sp.]|nr:tyrosine-type recombinase/integrase [Streptococcus sp.]
MQDNYTSKGKYLTELERQLIERWYNKEKLSNREIAYRLGRSSQTIHNEIQSGAVQLKYKTKYSAKIAQDRYKTLRTNSKRSTKLTAQLDEQISKAVKNKISLEVIHQEIKSEVCLRTLYNWIAKGEKETVLMLRQYKNHQQIQSWQLGRTERVVFSIFTDSYANTSFLRRALKRHFNNTEVTDVGFHEFRHTHASIMMNAGIQYNELQHLLGHSTLSMTMDTYSHLSKNNA